MNPGAGVMRRRMISAAASKAPVFTLPACRQRIVGPPISGTAAGSIGQFAVVPAAQGLIGIYGWVSALNLLALSALVMALLALPLAPFSGSGTAEPDEKRQSVPEALRKHWDILPFVCWWPGFSSAAFMWPSSPPICPPF